MTLDTHNWSSSAHQEIHKILKEEIFPIVNQVDARLQNFEIQFLKEAAKFVRDFKSLAKEADESLAKHKALELEIERILRGSCQVKNIFYCANPSVLIKWGTNKGTSTNTKFAKQSILGKPPSSSRPKLYVVTHLPNSTAFPKVGKTKLCQKPVNLNRFPSSRESTVVNNERVIAPGIFRINPFKATRVDNFVPNKHVKASVRTKPIIVSQPHVITKNDVNSKTNGFSPKDIRSTTRTRRPKPWNNPIVIKYVNGMKSRKKNQSANVSKSANQKKHKLSINQRTKNIMETMNVTLDEFSEMSWKVYSVIYSTNYSNGEYQVVSKSSVVTTADASDKRQQQQDSTSSTSTLATTITADGNFDL
ncbi:hypothetical protein Tco_1155007 [Tanacetum coccineum]